MCISPLLLRPQRVIFIFIRFSCRLIHKYGSVVPLCCQIVSVICYLSVFHVTVSRLFVLISPHCHYLETGVCIWTCEGNYESNLKRITMERLNFKKVSYLIKCISEDFTLDWEVNSSG